VPAGGPPSPVAPLPAAVPGQAFST